MAALADITPQDVAGETTAAKALAANILLLATYLDKNSEQLWREYGDTWAGLSNAQKNQIITTLAAEARSTVTSTLLTWIRSFIDLVIEDQYKSTLLAKLQARLAALEAEVAQVQAKIAEITG